MSIDWQRIAEEIVAAEAIVIAAGAGMGVDSGLPDFRGDEGFWGAYPAFREAGRSFVDLANPRWFEEDPALAWGFYGHRLQLYRDTVPHEGFSVLREWADSKAAGGFAFTSNVDGQFQKAGFSDEQVVECHGSLMHLQCTVPCSSEIWSAGDIRVDVDMSTIRATSALPRCPGCGAVARPAILMFGDGRWNSARTDAQLARYEAWLAGLGGAKLVVVEMGAGTAVPTVRRHSEQLARRPSTTVVRINPREAHGSAGILSVPETAVVALRRIDQLLCAR